MNNIYYIKKNQAFTLIELLVIISIVAVLATVGSVVFSNVQNRVKDSARKADVIAIAKAMEANYDPVSGTYNASKIVAGAAFASGQSPTPPEGGNYFADLTQDSKGFKVCATLSDGSPFCIDSEQGAYNDTPPATGDILNGSYPGAPTPTSNPVNTPTLSGATSTPTPTPNLCPNNVWE